jgi:hypothetical protein
VGGQDHQFENKRFGRRGLITEGVDTFSSTYLMAERS